MTVRGLNQSLSLRPCGGVTEPKQGSAYDLLRQAELDQAMNEARRKWFVMGALPLSVILASPVNNGDE